MSRNRRIGIVAAAIVGLCMATEMTLVGCRQKPETNQTPGDALAGTGYAVGQAVTGADGHRYVLVRPQGQPDSNGVVDAEVWMREGATGPDDRTYTRGLQLEWSDAPPIFRQLR